MLAVFAYIVLMHIVMMHMCWKKVKIFSSFIVFCLSYVVFSCSALSCKGHLKIPHLYSSFGPVLLQLQRSYIEIEGHKSKITTYLFLSICVGDNVVK